MFTQDYLKGIMTQLISVADLTLTVNKNTVEIEGLGDGVTVIVSAPVSVVTKIMTSMEKSEKVETKRTIHPKLKSEIDMTAPTKGVDIEAVRKSSKDEKVATIRKLMEVEGLNQTEVAKRLGYTPSYISALLKNTDKNITKLRAM